MYVSTSYIDGIGGRPTGPPPLPPPWISADVRYDQVPAGSREAALPSDHMHMARPVPFPVAVGVGISWFSWAFAAVGVEEIDH